MEPETADAATGSAAAPAVQHSVWRQQNAGHGAAARLARALRRIVVALLAIALVIALAVLLITPFRHPETHLVMMSGAEGTLPAAFTDGPAPTFVAEDFQAFGALSQVLAQGKGESFPWWMKQVGSVAQLQAAGQRLDQMLDGEKDVLIVYVHAQAVSYDGRPALHWSFDAGSGDGGLFPTESLLDAISRRAAETRLLVLDAGRVAMEPQRGLLVNEFMRLLPTAVRAVRDDRLWVLTSHSLLEQSHVSWSAQRSVFGESVATGLHGAADLDGDQDIDVQELYRYVSADVWQRVQELTGGTQTQTPMLLWGGDGDPQTVPAPVLLPVSPLPASPPADQPSGTTTRTAAFDSLPLRNTATRRAPAAGALATPGYSARAGLTGAAYTAANQAVPVPVRTGLASTGIDPGRLAANRVGASMSGLSGRQATQSAPPKADGKSAADAAAAKPGSDAPAPDQVPPEGTKTPAVPAAGASEAPEQPKPSAVPELLMAGWRLRDDLEDRSGEMTSPVDFAPDLWKVFVQRLLACELNFRAGAIVDEAQLESALRRLLTPLQEAQENLLPGPRANREMAQLAEALIVNRRPPAIEPVSLGMARKFAGCCSDELPENLQQLQSALDQALTAGDRAAFDEWLKTLAEHDDRFIEVGLARRLAALPDLEWSLLQLALQTRLTAEAVAAAADQGGSFVRHPIDLADRLREAGEQALFDGVGSRRFARARRLFEQAEALYAAAERRRVTLQTAEILYRDLTFRVRDYLNWRAAQGQVPDSLGPRDADLKALLNHLQTMAALLQKTDALELSTLELHTAALASARDRIEASLSADSLVNGEGTANEIRKPPAAGLLPHLQSVLETPLPGADERLQCLQAIVPLDAHLQAGSTRVAVPRTPYPPRIESLDDWLLLEHRAERELRVAELVATEIPAASEPLVRVRSAFGKLHQCRVEAFATGDESSRKSAGDGIARLWDAYRGYGAALRNFHASVPRHLEQHLQEPPPIADANHERARTMRSRLRAALNVVRIMGTPPTAQSIAWGNQLKGLVFGRHLQWQAKRLRRTQENEFPLEASRLAGSAELLQEYAAHLLGEARGPVEHPILQVTAAAEVSLLEQSQQHVDFRLAPSTHAETPVWLVLKFDPQLLDVEPAPGISCYNEHTFWQPFDDGAASPPAPAAERSPEGNSANLNSNTPAGDLRSPAAGTGLAWASRLPYRPQQDSAPPTLKLLSGVAAEVSLRLRSLAPSPVPARLFVKAVTPTEIVTHEIIVHVPSPEVVRLQVDGVTGTFAPSSSGAILHPFPNQSTRYRYRLENRTDAQKSVSVAFYALGERPTRPIPQSELPPQEARRLLDTLNATTILAALPKQILPPRGSVGLALPQPEADPSEPAPDPPTPPGAAEPEKPLPQINSGLLLAVTDTQTGMQSLKLLDVSVQQPRRYIFPQVGYDFERERVTIVVRAQDPALLPPDGCRVQAEFQGALPSSGARQLSGIVQAPDYETRLFAEVPATDGKAVDLLLHVDGYPRAFRYRVPCDALSVDLPEVTDALGVRITSPADGVAYPHGVSEIEINAEVDVPLGTFHDPRDFVELGIDVNRDRVLAGEPTVRLHSDRSVDVRLQPPSPDGRLVVRSQVEDHAVSVPAASLGSARVGLLARASTHDRQAWSRSVDAVIDGEPPRIRSLRLIPGKFATAKDQLKVSVDATDGELSGIAIVEAAFDMAQTGAFTEETKPLPAALGPAGRWIVTLPLADLKPGTHTLLVRATDRVGNRSGYAKETVTVLDEEQAAARLAMLTSPVTGSLRYGSRPVPSAEVVLSNDKQEVVAATTSDALGQFVLPPVPPGKYQLLARGLMRNQVRRASAEVAVPPPPGETPPQQLQLR